MRDLILLRGLPGCGKSTLAKVIAPISNVAADDYFDEFHGGEFKPEKLKYAHEWCQNKCKLMMEFDNRTIVVHNTFTQNWEMKPYLLLAEKHGYLVHIITVENRHGSDSVHGVPVETLEKMRRRFEVVL